MSFNIALDSGAPSLYNEFVRAKGGSHMGSHMKDRQHDDFSFFSTKEFVKYRDEYIEFLHENEKMINIYFNLDVVNNARLTWKNQRYLEKKGLKPIPVYHFGSEEKWLKFYLDRGHDYIAIGGLIPNPPSILIPALDRLWDKYLTKKNGYPKIKVHGFALTSPQLVCRWPFYSVDSTSWVKWGKYGVVILPKFKGGKFNYKVSPNCICVSSRASKLKEIEGKHFSNLTDMEQTAFLQYLKIKDIPFGSSEFKDVPEGYKLQTNEYFVSKEKRRVEIVIERGVSNDYKVRDKINAYFYMDMSNAQPEWPWAFKQEKKTKGFL